MSPPDHRRPFPSFEVRIRPASGVGAPDIPAGNHIGFYPTPRGIEEFKDELHGYRG